MVCTVPHTDHKKALCYSSTASYVRGPLLSLAIETAVAICLYTVLNCSVEKLARERSGYIDFESSETECEGKGSRYITFSIQYMVVKVQAESRPVDLPTRVECLK